MHRYYYIALHTRVLCQVKYGKPHIVFALRQRQRFGNRQIHSNNSLSSYAVYLLQYFVQRLANDVKYEIPNIRARLYACSLTHQNHQRLGEISFST